MRKIANIKYIETTDIFSSTDFFFSFLEIKLKESSVEVTAGGGVGRGGSYYLYKHLTSIKRQEEKTAHTQNRTPERNDQKGAAQHPENTTEDRRKKTREERRDNTTTVSWVKLRASVHVVVMQDRPAPLTFLLDINQVDKRERCGCVPKKAGPGFDARL